jgi:hypothetical protein
MRSARDEARRRAQRDALQVLLPSAPEADLLRVALWEGEAGRDAWRQWHARVGDPVLAFARQHAAQKGLVPLLQVAARRNRLDLPPAFATYLRAA